jgi:hypothetical protein
MKHRSKAIQFCETRRKSQNRHGSVGFIYWLGRYSQMLPAATSQCIDGQRPCTAED